MADPTRNQAVADAIAKLANANFGIKFGPGALPVIGAIIGFGLIGSAVVGWALSKEPWAALTGMALTLGATTFLAIWSYRFVERNPFTAMLSGTQLFKLVQGEQAARDKSLVISSNDPPQVGGPSDKAQE